MTGTLKTLKCKENFMVSSIVQKQLLSSLFYFYVNNGGENLDMGLEHSL